MSLQVKLSEFAVAVAQQLNQANAKRGDLATLSTSSKTSIVAAINELSAALSNATGIDDSASSNSSTYSSDQINALITQAKADLLGGAPEALDTLLELANELSENDTQLESLLTGLTNRVRFDEAQTLNSAQQTRARSNIGAVASSSIGDPEHDFVADFEAALA